ncbi:sphingomyelin phosphodiesterase 5 [Brachyhypopomus gauderio]|uniref:sphingomyelin phosphodiesterase 5 n=1 Tax=Brachyhypopomus gauderio TaxID=698409 RepID=UPI00404296EE
MSLRESSFSSGFAGALHTLGWVLLFPCFWFLDRLIAVCISTSLERRQRREEECYLHPLKVFFGSILFLVLFLVSAPIALLGFLLWAPLQFARRPFSYLRVSVQTESRNAGWDAAGKISFGFVSANLCLLPDSLARFNNLGHSQRRAEVIGRSIAQGVSRPHIRILVDSPSSCGTLSASSSLIPHTGPALYGATNTETQPAVVVQAADTTPDGEMHKTSVVGASMPTSYDHTDNLHPSTSQQQPGFTNSTQQKDGGQRRPCTSGGPALDVSTLFPANVDIVCLQEVFDKRAAAKLASALGPVFGHVLYDVGVYACQPCHVYCSFKFFNSGLFLASRHPVLEAQYHCFPNGRGEDALAAKGLLSVKVQIGHQKAKKKMVGYFNCIHLHAPEGDGAIRCDQLDMVTEWIEEFQTVNRQEDEMVVFDVLCGDFNFDNCSPDDCLEQNHSLFNDYTDPCRAGPGKEKPWVIGTLLQQPTLYEENVNTPENLQMTLEDEELRKVYLAPPVPRDAAPLVYPEPGEPWVGRRIDYLLYREHTLSNHLQTDVEEFTYVTQLAGLTDHIPVGLRLNVTLDLAGDPAAVQTL